MRAWPAAPIHLAALVDPAEMSPRAGAHLGGVLGFLVLALGFGIWARRRIAGARFVTEPIRNLDALQRVARGGVLILRALLLPLLLLVAALGLRQLAPEELLLEVPVALAVAWIGFALARGVGAAFFRADADGRNLAGATADTARAARRVATLALGATAVWLAGAHLLRSAGLSYLGEVLGFAWAVFLFALAAWLWTRRDVLSSLIPSDTKSGPARAVRTLLHVAWPLGVVLWAANVVLYALGYRTAGAFFARRAIVFLLALLVLGIVHSMLRAWLLRHAPTLADDSGDDAFDPVLARRQVIGRFLGQLLAIGTIAGLVAITSAVFEVDPGDWHALGAWSLTGGEAGVGITLARVLRSVIIFVATVMIARHVRDIVRIVLRTRGRLEQGTRYVVRTLLFYLMLAIGTVASLAALGLDMTQFGWFLTAAGVGIGFGLQEILSNLISGLILFFERPVQVGDVVTVGAVEGNVQQINIRSTVVRTRDGVSIILPNKRLITDEVINWSHTQKRTRLNLDVGVAYGSDVELVKKVLLDCAMADLRVMRRPPPEVEFRSFGESQLSFILHCWLTTPEISLRRRVQSDLNAAIDRAFAENGITIPFPQRDIHIKSPPPPSDPSAT